MSIIHFKTATQTAYDNLITKDSGTLYFTTDTHHIYKGDVQYGSGIPLQDLGTVDLTSYNNDYVTYLSTLNTGWYTVELEDQIFIVSVQTDTGNNYKIITYSSSEDLEEFYFLFVTPNSTSQFQLYNQRSAIESFQPKETNISGALTTILRDFRQGYINVFDTTNSKIYHVRGHISESQIDGFYNVFQTYYEETNPTIIYMRKGKTTVSGITITTDSITWENWVTFSNDSFLPTKVSDLTNDSGFLTSTDLATYGYATQTYVDQKAEQSAAAAAAAVVGSAPTTLDTLNELAAALGNDANFATTVTNSLASKVDLEDLATVATSGSYLDLVNRPSNVSSFTNDAGYLTSHQSLANYSTTSEVQTMINTAIANITDANNIEY